MVSRARLRSILTGLALYALAAMLVGYFGINAFSGKYGLRARQTIDHEIEQLTAENRRLRDERSALEHKVALLRTDRIDPDMLDERARAQLDYLHPHDVVIFVSPTH